MPATTTKYGFPYPVGSDTPDVPRDMQALAVSLDGIVAGSPAYGTSLPASPYDGQEAILVDSTTNPTYQWRFRYNASSTSTYKWEFVGGAPAVSYVATAEGTTTTGSWVDLTTLGPDITLARAGDYILAWSVDVYHTVSPAFVQSAPAVAAAAPNVLLGNGTPSLNQPNSINAFYKYVAVPASALCRLRYVNGTAGTATFRTRSLQALPVRVA